MFVHLLQEQVSSSMCIVYTCRSTCTCTCTYVQRSFHLQQPFNATTAHTHTVYDVYDVYVYTAYKPRKGMLVFVVLYILYMYHIILITIFHTNQPVTEHPKMLLGSL